MINTPGIYECMRQSFLKMTCKLCEYKIEMFHELSCYFCFPDDTIRCLETSYAKSGPEYSSNLMRQKRTQRAALVDQSQLHHLYFTITCILGIISNSYYWARTLAALGLI